MFNWNWVLANKENITWVCVSIGGAYAFFKWLHKAVWKPSSLFIDRVKKALSELEPNGGGSIKDIVKSDHAALKELGADVKLIKTVQKANIRLNPDCIFQCDSHSKCIMANDSLCRLFGATKEQMLGFGWASFIKPSEREDAREAWESAVENDNEITYEYTIIHGVTGDEIKCIYTAYIDRNPNTNEVMSIFGIVNKKN